jgi:hypothetical protein
MYFEQGNLHWRIIGITGARHLMAGVYISTASSPVIANTSHGSFKQSDHLRHISYTRIGLTGKASGTDLRDTS